MKYYYCSLILICTGLFCANNLFCESSNDSMLMPGPGITDLDFLSELEKEVVIELNLARTNPKKYASKIEQFKRFYAGNYIYIAGQTQIATREGVSAVNEAIDHLRAITPLQPLKVSRGLSQAAQAHMNDQGETGLTGHRGSDNSTPGDRIDRFGTWGGSFGENIEYGNFTASQIVMQLIIDDGIPNRSHRKNIFKSSYTLVGVSCGPHHSFGSICVMDFAGSYTENQQSSEFE
jgi:uncharacterized protein YkwD